MTMMDFLEYLKAFCYKIASFNMLYILFLEYHASKGRPMIMSTGIADHVSVIETMTATL
mgnify:CR=1 FL=1